MTASVITNGIRVQPRTYPHLRYVPIVALGADLALLSLSVLAAIQWRQLLPFIANDPNLAANLTVFGPAMIAGWMLTIFVLGGYRERTFGAGTDEFKLLVYASMATAALVGVTSFLIQFPLSRGFFVLAFVTGTPALMVGRGILRSALHRARRNGALQRRVVIAGTEGHVDEVASVLRREQWLGYDVIGALTPSPGERTATHLGVPILGSARSVASVALAAGADVVFLAGGAFDSASDMRRLAWDLEHEDVQVVIAPSVTDVASERVSVRPVGGLPLIHMEKPRSAAAVRSAKRSFDIVVSLLLLLAFSPVFVFAAVRIWMHDRGPILFSQTRVGRDGDSFKIWKFRTMVVDAEALLAKLHADEGYQGGLFKIQEDPRITVPGRWLRRFSIDELPQLVNVLVGHMSLIGPRPPLAYEVAQYDDDMARRLRVRPGMTGLWQVSGRSDLSWTEAIRLDLYYVDNWSMLQDLVILARTAWTVLAPKGAY